MAGALPVMKEWPPLSCCSKQDTLKLSIKILLLPTTQSKIRKQSKSKETARTPSVPILVEYSPIGQSLLLPPLYVYWHQQKQLERNIKENCYDPSS